MLDIAVHSEHSDATGMPTWDVQNGTSHALLPSEEQGVIATGGLPVPAFVRWNLAGSDLGVQL